MPAEQRPVGGRKITPAHRLASKFGREFIPGQDFDRFKPIHIRLGRFPSLQEAHAAYLAKKAELYPDFYTNDVDIPMLKTEG